MGIYEVDGETDDIVSMADRAYIARQTIKNKGDTAWAFYDGAVRDKLLHEKEIESQMEKALAEGEFIAYYQPKYSTKEQKLIGAEALVRWRRSDGIIVPPYQFVPLFERNGFINKVDRYMFELVCRQQMRWLKQGLIPVPISVNMSRMCLYDPHIVDEYIGVLNGSGLSAAYIKLELTESAFFENISIMNNVIEALHKVGIKVLMDDFGTGYSSMMMLKNVAIDVLKLDKSFVDDIGDDRSEKIISNIIYLAHSLQIEVTAEGVETAAQFEFLKSVGCDYIQGYYFYKLNPDAKVDKQPSVKLSHLLALVKAYGLFLFLGCGEYDDGLKCNFNSCIIFGPKGNICGTHRKLISHGSGAEAWASRADVLEPVDCGNVKVGALVCADAWYSEHAQKMQQKGAQIIIDIAAWPPTAVCGNPLGAWEKCSEVTGLPMLVCNQTGVTEWMDMTVGQSVVIENGKTKLSYNGKQAILLFEWDENSGKILSDKFEIISI